MTGFTGKLPEEICAPFFIENKETHRKKMIKARKKSMKKRLKQLLVVGILSVCLVSLIIYWGRCEELPQIEVLFSPEQGEEILTELTEAIQGAEERIYILIYSFTLDELARVLIDKHEEGIDVRVIMDRRQANSSWTVAESLREAGVPLIVRAGSKGGYMHLKVLIADETVFTGSYNYSKKATYNSDENFLIIRDKRILQIYLEKFKRLWTNGQRD